jgi:hypothetical protein
MTAEPKATKTDDAPATKPTRTKRTYAVYQRETLARIGTDETTGKDVLAGEVHALVLVKDGVAASSRKGAIVATGKYGTFHVALDGDLEEITRGKETRPADVWS